MKELLTLSVNLNTTNIILLSLGTIAYFVMEYKLKQGDSSFSIGYWIRDNWYNVVFSLTCITAYFIIQDSVSKLEAFSLGLAPNLIADWVGNIIQNMKNKVSGK